MPETRYSVRIIAEVLITYIKTTLLCVIWLFVTCENCSYERIKIKSKLNY